MARRGRRLGIGWEWVALAVLLTALGKLGAPGSWGVLIAAPLGILAGLAALSGLVSARCPNCFRRELEPAAKPPPGRRFVRCRDCGGRWTRTLLGAWEEADGAEHDPAFSAASRPTDPWKGGPVVDEAAPLDGTHGNLLRGKRDRQAPADRASRRRPALPPDESRI